MVMDAHGGHKTNACEHEETPCLCGCTIISNYCSWCRRKKSWATRWRKSLTAAVTVKSQMVLTITEKKSLQARTGRGDVFEPAMEKASEALAVEVPNGIQETGEDRNVDNSKHLKNLAHELEVLINADKPDSSRESSCGYAAATKNDGGGREGEETARSHLQRIPKVGCTSAQQLARVQPGTARCCQAGRQLARM